MHVAKPYQNLLYTLTSHTFSRPGEPGEENGTRADCTGQNDLMVLSATLGKGPQARHQQSYTECAGSVGSSARLRK